MLFRGIWESLQMTHWKYLKNNSNDTFHLIAKDWSTRSRCFPPILQSCAETIYGCNNHSQKERLGPSKREYTCIEHSNGTPGPFLGWQLHFWGDQVDWLYTFLNSDIKNYLQNSQGAWKSMGKNYASLFGVNNQVKKQSQIKQRACDKLEFLHWEVVCGGSVDYI